MCNFVELPVSSIDQTIQLQLKSKDTGLDVFSYGTEDLPNFVAAAETWPRSTPTSTTARDTAATYNFTDVAPAIEASCQSGGKTYCIASHAGGALLYYNTAMFKAAGITSPPQIPQQLLADAKKLTTPAPRRLLRPRRQVAGPVRRIPDVELVHPLQQPDHRDVLRQELEFPDRRRSPTPPRSGRFYRDILQNAAPKGIATYLVDNCLQDFQQGRVAMWQDDSGSIPLGPRPDPVQGGEQHGVLGDAVPAGQPQSLRPGAAVRRVDEQRLPPQGRRVAAHPVPDLTRRRRRAPRSPRIS